MLEKKFRSEDLNRLYNAVVKSKMAPAPGWVGIDVPKEVQYSLNVGPVARARPDMATGAIEIAYGPADIDIRPFGEHASMESLLPSFREFAKGGICKMPKNMDIYVPESRDHASDVSKKAERSILRKLVSSIETRPTPLVDCLACGGQVKKLESDWQQHADVHGLPIDQCFQEGRSAYRTVHSALVLQNPSLMVHRIVAEKENPTIVCSEEWEETYKQELCQVRDETRRHLGDPLRVSTFPNFPPGLVYTGSLGMTSRARNWIGLVPDPYGPNVVGRQHFEWGILFQYQRQDKHREITFEYSPAHNRYTTEEYFGIVSPFYVITTERIKQTPGAGKRDIIGFTDDCSPRFHGRLGRILPVGKYVVRIDTTVPERHTMYYPDGPFVHYGACSIWKKDRKYPMQVYCMTTMTEKTLENDKQAFTYPPHSLATFFGPDGYHSKEIQSVKFGSYLSPVSSFQYDSRVTRWASGMSDVDHRLPRAQNTFFREDAMAMMKSGTAVLREGMLEPPRDIEFDVSGEGIHLSALLQELHRTPVPGVLVTCETESYLRAIGIVVSVGMCSRATVFSGPVPRAGWAMEPYDVAPEADFSSDFGL